MKKLLLVFSLLPLLVACQPLDTGTQAQKTNTDNGGEHASAKLDCCDIVTLTYDSKRCSGFKKAHETFQATNGSFPCLVLNFDDREEYDSTYEISGAGKSADSLKLEGAKLMDPKFSFSYQYWPKTTQSDVEKAIFLSYEVAKPMTIENFRSSSISLSRVGNSLCVAYEGNDVLSIAISYDSRYVNYQTVEDFCASLKKDFIYLA